MVDIADTITVEEFIRILDRRPDLLEALRQRVLTRELLELPEKFAAFVAETRAFAAETRAFADEMRAFVSETRAFAAETRDRLDRIEGRLDRSDGRLNRVEGRLGNMEGWQYETKLDRMLLVFCLLDLNMNDPVVLMSQGSGAAPEFNSLIQRLRNEGNLDTDKFREVIRCDAIARDGEGRYTLFEASITVDESDVERAIRRADMFAEIVGAPTAPAVVGVEIGDALRESAADRGVSFLYMSPRNKD